jgi:hypothetical protein
MGYIKKIEESKLKVYNQAVATRILDLINKLRLNSNEYDERRWIWELIQNAKDVAFEDQGVSICIDLEINNDSYLELRHNGKPFSIDNITFLIEQVSTNDRINETDSKNRTTGRFGTGFLTTHLLSEEVEVKGVVKEPNLPYKKFSLQLDRSGTKIDEIIRAVNQSIDLLSELDNTEEFKDFDKKDHNTTFRYSIDENGITAAKKGISDLEISLPFTLAFVPSIKSVCINNSITYSLLPQVTVEGENIDIYTINKKTGSETVDFNIAVVSSDRVSVAIQIEYKDESIYIIEPSEKLPKLFCDFPLVGSEDFNMPVIVHSSLFNPTEPRNGIFLSDKAGNQIVENKNLLIEARDLYFKLLRFAAQNNWQNMYVLAKIALPKAKDWISREWFADLILNPVRQELLRTPLIDNPVYGRIPIECSEFNNMPKGARVDFPKHAKSAILAKFWNICNNSYFLLPNENDYLEWSKIIWDEKYIINLNSIIKLIELKGNIDALSKTLGKTKQDTIEWLNEYYALLVEEADLIRDISTKAIYPNQNGIFKKKEELLFEKTIISEMLKDIVKDLGNDFREKLLDNEIKIELPQNSICIAAGVANEITNLIKHRLAELQRSAETKSIFKKLYLWFSQNKEEADKIFDYLYKNKHKLLDDEEIASSIEKAGIYEELLKEDPLLSLERIKQLLELEELSKGFDPGQPYAPDEEQKRKNFLTGWKGEAYVWKVLLEKGFSVEWPNKSENATSNIIVDFEGEKHFIDDKGQKYDLLIKYPDKKNAYVQVKSTTTNIRRANEIALPISVREWDFVNEKADDDTYYLARVFDVSSAPDVYFMKVDKIETI